MNQVAGKVKINFRSDEPIYLQIARQIEELVGNGGLNVGDQLPTVREMATELCINFNTVARAYRLLDEARLISTQRGRGTYIWEKPTEETILILKEEALENLLQNLIVNIEKLGFTVKEAVTVLEQLQTKNTPE
ncbi:MAG: GntR family transcriptional regulator [Leptolinea sp.]